MGEALAYLTDYLSEGLEETAGAAGAEVAPTNSAVTLDTTSLPEQEPAPAADEAVSVEPKPKRKRAPKKIADAVTSIDVPSLPSLKDLPTPGGIGFLLFLILFILFAFATNADGQTRLSLLWAVIRGQADWTSNSSSSSSDLPGYWNPEGGSTLDNGNYFNITPGTADGGYAIVPGL